MKYYLTNIKYFCQKCGSECELKQEYADDYLETDCGYNGATGQRIKVPVAKCPNYRWYSIHHRYSLEYKQI